MSQERKLPMEKYMSWQIKSDDDMKHILFMNAACTEIYCNSNLQSWLVCNVLAWYLHIICTSPQLSVVITVIRRLPISNCVGAPLPACWVELIHFYLILDQLLPEIDTTHYPSTQSSDACLEYYYGFVFIRPKTKETIFFLCHWWPMFHAD